MLVLPAMLKVSDMPPEGVKLEDGAYYGKDHLAGFVGHNINPKSVIPCIFP
jgi:hypothetical protein